MHDYCQALAELVIEMRDARDDYGCGYYNQDRWLNAYRAAVKMAEKICATTAKPA